MSSRRLSADARRFLAEHVGSVLQLELVLLLARDPARAWTAADAASELRAPAEWIGGRLAELATLGVAATQTDAYTFVADGPWAPAIDEVATQFARRRTSIIEAIFG
ncbi:MAG TPA: hypothetical protein VFG42_14945 [Baekduia sp.]|uniref:hypothetical protein n=1 Tax=Baekduia sp. TaxID=2600305 RepID=UPI002D79E435|nr:hypothetical protein [Baekduia sp.]HET6508086.1 hypothetical protein [Baekduia sp.]